MARQIESLESLLAEWHTNPGKDLAPKTRDRYRGAIRRFFAWFEEVERRPILIADLHPITLVGYRETLKQTEAVSTVNIHLSALRTWCTWLVEQGHIESSPTRRLKLVGKEKSTWEHRERTGRDYGIDKYAVCLI